MQKNNKKSRKSAICKNRARGGACILHVRAGGVVELLRPCSGFHNDFKGLWALGKQKNTSLSRF